VESDVEILKSRLSKNVSMAEFQELRNTIAVFPLNAQVNIWNIERLLEIGENIVKITPKPKAGYSPLPSELNLYLCKNAKIILTKNLCLEYNLVNGSRGTVHSIFTGKDQSQI
jgi:hypothetical protein